MSARAKTLTFVASVFRAVVKQTMLVLPITETVSFARENGFIHKGAKLQVGDPSIESASQRLGFGGILRKK